MKNVIKDEALNLTSTDIEEDMLSMHESIKRMAEAKKVYFDSIAEYDALPMIKKLFNKSPQNDLLDALFHQYSKYEDYRYLNEVFREIWFSDRAWDKLTVSDTRLLEDDVKRVAAKAGEFMALSWYKGDALYERLIDLGVVDFIEQYEANKYAPED